MKLEFARQFSEKFHFMKISPVRAEKFHADRQTELIVAFRNFAKSPNNMGDYKGRVVRCVREIAKATVSFVMPVCPSAHPSIWNNSSPTKRIFVNFDISIFFESLSGKFKYN